MAYEKQNFEDGQVLTAEHLNKMEEELARAKSWNDLTDKPFGETYTVILEEQELTQGADGEMIVPSLAPIQDGDELVVVYNGQSYACTAFVYIELPTGVMFGNLATLSEDLPDTGEPFLCLFMEGAIILVPTGEAPPIVKISKAEITKIPEKYIPGKKFYIKQSETPFYLYTDIDCQNKATIVDIPNTTDFEIGLSSTQAVIQWYRPLCVDSNLKVATQGYAEVVVLGGGAFTSCYTAEYTPE